ncbi:dephospho-CoA kinase [Specibacter sp. NPDC057265]|uniref:dephospho-CoA kinase n=1 Tax=Specibacter sp. NPDC057265 TaxID=3346075 RepID=UPI00362FE3F7
MLSLGLTGGIAAGKSLLTTRLRELGAVVIDADRLARDVVAPGTPGLAAIVANFGDRILQPDGSLHRAKLGSLVFADQSARESLNAIVHPRVRRAANALKRDAGEGSIVVQDIPLLVESGQQASFHLVLVVQARAEERIARMVLDRGMTREDAVARMSAQASDEQRAAAADVVISNNGSPEQAVAELDALWRERLLPFAANMAARRPADHVAGKPGAAGNGGAEAARVRLAARLEHVVDGLDCAVESDAGGLVFTIRQRPEAVAPGEELTTALAGAGFFPKPMPPSGPEVLYSADPAVVAGVRIMPGAGAGAGA